MDSLQGEVDQELTKLIDEAPAESTEITETKANIDQDFKEAS
jgi:hypothetical protein